MAQSYEDKKCKLKMYWDHASLDLELKNSQDVFEDVIKRYSEPHRAYHNINHIYQMQLERLVNRSAVENNKPLIENSHELSFAIFMHDVVCDKDGHNEQRSINYLNSLDMPEKYKQNIEKLVQVTDHVTIPVATDEKVIVDLDLAILGSTPAVFDDYELGIRKEYDWLDDNFFNNGRIAVLKQFLDRDRIYYTDTFHKRYEEKARINIERSIKKLEEKIN